MALALEKVSFTIVICFSQPKLGFRTLAGYFLQLFKAVERKITGKKAKALQLWKNLVEKQRMQDRAAFEIGVSYYSVSLLPVRHAWHSVARFLPFADRLKRRTGAAIKKAMSLSAAKGVTVSSSTIGILPGDDLD